MQELPMGFAFALAQNPKAKEIFSGLNETEQQQLAEQSKTMRSRAEMRRFVYQLSENQGGV